MQSFCLFILKGDNDAFSCTVPYIVSSRYIQDYHKHFLINYVIILWNEVFLSPDYSVVHVYLVYSGIRNNENAMLMKCIGENFIIYLACIW